MGYILVGSKGRLSEAEYRNKVRDSTVGRIPYAQKIYRETAFQWLGPIVVLFNTFIDEDKRYARAYWLSAGGRLEATCCEGVDSWGYHHGHSWHKTSPTEEDLEKENGFWASSPETRDRFFNGRVPFLSGNGYLKECRRVWAKRARENLNFFVSYEEHHIIG